jgi:hypothetical protein
MDLKACKVYESFNDYFNNEYDDRESFLYNQEEIDLLSSYGFLITYDLEALYIKEASKYTKRKR